jgi:3-oxoacyl-(acyl-carrier-protein) synthase
MNDEQNRAPAGSLPTLHAFFAPGGMLENSSLPYEYRPGQLEMAKAVERALADLRSGRIETAIVGGVNMLLSPASFVGFSRAQMLSPTGACRPFSAKGDGYVRSEGGAVFILQRGDVADPGAIRALIKGAGINSDGRTSGIALPGLDGQASLLERVYAEAGISPEDLAFVEAHGTGTVVGDPIEAPVARLGRAPSARVRSEMRMALSETSVSRCTRAPTGTR